MAEFDVMADCVAVIVVDPFATPDAKPLPLIVATPVDVDAQVAVLVTSVVVVSLHVAMAVYCCVPRRGMVVLVGVIAIETSVGATY